MAEKETTVEERDAQAFKRARGKKFDLLERLIEIVEEHISPEYGCRSCDNSGNAHYVHKEKMQKCREEMTEAIKAWVHEVIGAKY